MKELKAKDIMTPNVVWVPEDLSVSEATELFIQEMISGAPVVDENGNMIGVVSMRDFLKNGRETQQLTATDERVTVFYNESWELPLTAEEASAFHLEVGKDLTVKDIMTPVVFNADLNTPVVDLAEMMLKGRIHRIVVLDGNELAGMVTTMDMLKAICYEGEKAG